MIFFLHQITVELQVFFYIILMIGRYQWRIHIPGDHNRGEKSFFLINTFLSTQFGYSDLNKI